MTLLIVVTGTGAFAVALMLTPLVLLLCRKYRLYDPGDPRKVHRGDTPRLGGFALFAATLFAVVYTAMMLEPDFIPLSRMQLTAFVGGGVLFFALGFIDDLWHLSARVKLPLQILFALGVAWAGVSVGTLFGTLAIPVWLDYLLTVFWIVGIVNTINFIDGLDGLSSGISAIAFMAILALSLAKGDYFFTLVSLGMLGALLGFLPYNFYPARIFVGDGGALLMGYYLATISILGFFKQTAVIAFLLPLLILVVPIADTAFAIGRRLAGGKPITAPDKKHIHHRLLFLFNRRYRHQLMRNGVSVDEATRSLIEGLAHRNTVLILYGASALFGALAVLLGLRG